ncbi:GNAT family N-acetyltransferase [Streptomyces sp. NPDC051840]|uniref:GNAT family N-acetyltransferase n=1 Tax=Streptomyces sp. NPDC051840 TaxID=3154752 RepID=UPI00341A941E
MIIRLAERPDLDGVLALAVQVEEWFGPMVEEPGFHRAVEEHIRDARALVAVTPDGRILGGLLFGGDEPTYHVHWLVISEEARGTGVGRALMDEAMRRFVPGPGSIEVITFGADHPGAVTSGARVFYERLGFIPAEPAGPGPEGGSRQVYRRQVRVEGTS